MEDKIIEIIEELTENKDLRKNREMDLIENEILDSLAFIEFIYKLEEEFDIEIQPTQVKTDTWRKISTIEGLIKELKKRFIAAFIYCHHTNHFHINLLYKHLYL